MDKFPTVRWWNLSQCFTQVEASLERSFWPVDAATAVRPLYWGAEDDRPTITLTRRRPSAAAARLGLSPRQEILPPPAPCGDPSWLDAPEGKAIVALARDAGGLRLAPSIWTRQTQLLCEALRREGLAVEAEIACSHGRIFHWNTRVGMRELFLSIPSLARYLPPSMVCHDAHQVDVAVARLINRAMVVKSNFALGGAGTSMLPQNEAFPGFDSMAKGKKKAGFSWAMRDEPTIVEEFVGDVASNLSITVDARQEAAGVAIAGLSEQLLVDGFEYAGVRSLAHDIRSKHEEELRNIAGILGAALARHGYDGWFNFDCVATQAGQLALVDLNVRRSAPLDAHQIVNRLARAGSPVNEYSFDEIAATGLQSDDDAEEALLHAGLHFDGRAGTLALGAPDAAVATLPVMTVAVSGLELKDRLNALRQTFV